MFLLSSFVPSFICWILSFSFSSSSSFSFFSWILLSLSSLSFSFSFLFTVDSLIFNLGNCTVSNTNKSLKGNLNLSPPNMYILVPSTHTVWPSRGSGNSPFIQATFWFNFSFSSCDKVFKPCLIFSGSEVKIKVFLIFTTFGLHKTWSAYFPSISLFCPFLLSILSFFLIFFFFVLLSAFFVSFFLSRLPFSFCFFWFFFAFSFSLSFCDLLSLNEGFVLFSTSLRVNHLNFCLSFLFSEEIFFNSSLVNCSKRVSCTHE